MYHEGNWSDFFFFLVPWVYSIDLLIQKAILFPTTLKFHLGHHCSISGVLFQPIGLVAYDVPVY